ncbi:MAG TPA: RnfABCDGE type electron transport complex subunit G [Parasulfuritortus sp.]
MGLDSLRGKLAYQGMLLAAVTMVTGGALALADHATKDVIEAAKERDMKQSLTQVLPGQYDNDLLKDTVSLPGPDGTPLTVYRARRAGKVEAVVFQVSAIGYAGPVVSMMGVDRDGRILGVRVIQHKETPGLGDKVEPSKTNWIYAFDGKYLGNPPADKFAVKKDGGVFDQFAGATITPRAVVKSVKGGLEFFAREKGKLLDDGQPANGEKS